MRETKESQSKNRKKIATRKRTIIVIKGRGKNSCENSKEKIKLKRISTFIYVFDLFYTENRR